MATVTAVVNGKNYTWTLEPNGSVRLNGERYGAEVLKGSSGAYTVLLDGRVFRILISRNDLHYVALINGNKYELDIESSTKTLLSFENNNGRTIQSQIEIRSPMPGMVVRCEVSEGEQITAGDGLLVLEAMKMENEIRATHSGIVKKVLVNDRQVVDKGELLLIIE